MFKCHVCGSEESHLEYVGEIFNINGAFHLVKHVPATVCDRCGEKAFSRETTEHIRVKLNGKQHVAVVESDRWTKRYKGRSIVGQQSYHERLTFYKS